MKYRTVPLLASIFALAGCLATTPPIQNPNGQPVRFVSPVLGKSAMANARYVLIEKSIADGKYHVVSMSKSRQPITNARQERIAFTDDLTGFAPDFTDYSFQTYSDPGNYGQETVVMRCASVQQKTDNYSPCSSDFAGLFIPMGITKSYVAGQISYESRQAWENPATNKWRYVRSPMGALQQAGVFERLTELANAN